MVGVAGGTSTAAEAVSLGASEVAQALRFRDWGEPKERCIAFEHGFCDDTMRGQGLALQR